MNGKSPNVHINADNSKLTWLLYWLGRPSLHIAFVLLLSTLAYLPSLDNELTNWDDEAYITDNDMITSFSAANMEEIFSTKFMGNYHPFALLSYAVDYHFGGLDPYWYNYTALIIHLVTVWLIWLLALRIFRQTGRRGAVFVAFASALLFGLHPVHVESVVWTSERKDVLYALFYFTSLLLYLNYLKSNDWRALALSVLVFVFSCLAKGMAVTLSLSIVLVDYLYRRPLLSRRLILEKIPFFTVSALFGGVAVFTQSASGAIATISYTYSERILFAMYGFVQYIVKFLMPLHLSPIYPYPREAEYFIPWQHLMQGSLTGIYGATYIYPFLFFCFLFWFVSRKLKDRLYSFAFLFFIANIVLMLQLLPVGGAVMADRYNYVASFGLIFALSSGLYALYRRAGIRRIVAITLLSGYALFFGAKTYTQSDVWQDSISMWTHVLDKYPVGSAYSNRGNAYKDKGDFYNAMADYQESLKLEPNDPDILMNLGVLKKDMGDMQTALALLNRSAGLNPDNPPIYLNRGIVYRNLNRYDLSMADYNRALSLKPDYAAAYVNRGNLKRSMQDSQGSLQDLSRAISIAPRLAEAWLNRGITYAQMGRFEQAYRDIDQSLKIKPNLAQGYFLRGMAAKELGMDAAACADFRRATDMGLQNASLMLMKHCR